MQSFFDLNKGEKKSMWTINSEPKWDQIVRCDLKSKAASKEKDLVDKFKNRAGGQGKKHRKCSRWTLLILD